MKKIFHSKAMIPATQQRQLITSQSTRLIQPQKQIPQFHQQKETINIPNASLEQEIKCYDWRIKTEFPIIKIISYKIVTNDSENASLEVQYQSYPIRLNQLHSLPLFKMLYLLKESIIAFQRLYDRFGAFTVSSKAIAINNQNKCKVWLNQNFASNYFTPKARQQRSFLLSIYKLFIQASNKLKTTANFFRELQQLTSFCQALAFIQNYARQNKISIANSCKLNQKQYTPQLHSLSQSVEQLQESTFNPSLTMTRTPKFFNSSFLRNSFANASRINIKPFLQQVAKMECPEDINMKASGDTSADLYQNNSQQHQDFDQSIIFGNPQISMVKAPTQAPQHSKQIQLLRHHSDNNSPSSNLFQLQTTQYEINISRPPAFEKSYRQTESQDENQNMQLFKQSVANIFNKNKWQKNLNCLFVDADNLKKSTHNGKQKRRKSSKQLLLLESVNPNLSQSIIQGEYVQL